MSQLVSEDLKTAKELKSQIVQWENRTESLKLDIESLRKQKETLESEIDAKKTDFQLYMGNRDSEVKKARELLLQEQTKLDQDKADFINILESFKREQEKLKVEKDAIAVDKNKAQDQISRVQQFVIALQRAYSLLGE